MLESAATVQRQNGRPNVIATHREHVPGTSQPSEMQFSQPFPPFGLAEGDDPLRLARNCRSEHDDIEVQSRPVDRIDGDTRSDSTRGAAEYICAVQQGVLPAERLEMGSDDL